jgi:hypothetical protein
MPNHEDMDSSEHQIRLSKGLIAKFVQRLKLGARFCRAKFRRQMKKPPRWWLLFAAFCDWNCIYFKSSKLVGMKWQKFATFPDVGVTCM